MATKIRQPNVNEHYSHRYGKQINVRPQTDDKARISLDKYSLQMAALVPQIRRLALVSDRDRIEAARMVAERLCERMRLSNGFHHYWDSVGGVMSERD